MYIRIVLLPVLLATACGSGAIDPAPTPVKPDSTSVNADKPQLDAGALARARSAMKMLGTTLKGELVKTMKAEGPTAALQVCATDAQALTASVAANAGVKVGRSSLRLRNPSDAGPNWVADWLKQQGERSATEVEGMATTAERDDGTSVVRALAPIAIEAPCLVCHGPDEGRSAELSAILADKYPGDKATGYALGDLRGAIWAEAPVVNTGMELQLDGRAKWQLDESTRNAMAVIRTSLSGQPPSDVPGAHMLATSIDASVAEMVQECSMEGASHDQLHLFLKAFFPAIAALKKSTNMDQASRGRWLLQAQVAEMDVHFE